jgi:hypothetical protein
MGTTPSKRIPPSKKEYVKLTALECTGVIRYARGARSWATSNEHEITTTAAGNNNVRNRLT